MRTTFETLFALVFGLLTATVSSAQVIPDVGKSTEVCIQTWMGTYVCAEEGGGGLVVANRAEADEWETFKIRRIDETHVTLQTSSGKFLCAENGGGGLVVANRDKARSWETFGLSLDSSGRVFLTSENGMFLCAESSGLVVANRQTPDSWEGFRLVTPQLANRETYRIIVNVYKLGREPIWHTGTVIEGKEYYFNSSNRVESCRPGEFANHHRTIVRFVPGNKQRALATLEHLKNKWNGTRYDIAMHNCNFFTNNLLIKLGASPLDGEYLRASGLAQLGKNVPGLSTAQELIVKWPIEDKRLDESVMEDLRRVSTLPLDTVEEFVRAGKTINEEAKRARDAMSEEAKRIRRRGIKW